MRDWGLPVEPHWRRCDGIDEVVAFCDEWAEKRRTLDFDTDGVVIKVDDLALRAAARRDREVSALGDRLQVSGAAGHDDAAGDRGQRRAHRRGHAVRRARAGVSRRLDDLDGDAAQRRGHRAQGSARRRPRRSSKRAATSSRKVVKPILPHPPTSATPWQMPTDCPSAASVAAPRRRRSRLALREHVVPGAHPAQPGALRVAVGDEHRRARRIADRSADRAGAGSATSPTSTGSTAEQLENAGRHAARAAVGTGRPRKLGKVGRNVIAQIERSRANDLLAPDLRAGHPPRRREGGRRRSRAISGRWMRSWTRRSSRCRRSPEIGPVVAASVRAFADEPRNRELVSELARGWRQHGQPGAGAGRRSWVGWPARPSC